VVYELSNGFVPNGQRKVAKLPDQKLPKGERDESPMRNQTIEARMDCSAIAVPDWMRVREQGRKASKKWRPACAGQD
jgi:hypothetical protein